MFAKIGNVKYGFKLIFIDKNHSFLSNSFIFLNQVYCHLYLCEFYCVL